MPRGLSHRTVVELLGDMTALAKALRISPANSVASWKKPDRGIPPLYWPAICRLARRRGYDITPDDLARTSPSVRVRKRRKSVAPDDDTREAA